VWIENEVLYREGLALQLDQGDDMIRERVIFKQLSVIDANTKLPPYDDEVLRESFEKNRAKYDEPARYDFQEAILVGDRSESSVRAFVSSLNAGAPGDVKADLRVFKHRPRENLVQSYSAEFAAALDAGPVGEWQALATRDGWRAMRLESITKPQSADFEAIKGRSPPRLGRCHARRAAQRRGARTREEVHDQGRGQEGTMRALLRVVSLCALAALALLSSSAFAHEMTMAEMELRESSPGEFLWQWTASGNVPPSEELQLVWPHGCSADASVVEAGTPDAGVVDAGVVRCGPEGLRGTLAVEGVGDTYSAMMLKVFWLDGQKRVYTFTSAQQKAQLYGSAEDKRGMGEIARAYTVLGIEHILTGFDHLMFVLALLFLVGFNRQLLFTITAFTLAHSLTLALSALGLLTLRSPPVEATIALSIVLVAAEAFARTTHTVAALARARRVSVRVGARAGIRRRAAGNRLAAAASLHRAADIQRRRRDRPIVGRDARVRAPSCAGALAHVRDGAHPCALRHRRDRGVLVVRPRRHDPQRLKSRQRRRPLQCRGRFGQQDP
jgi:hypothetical protein